LRGREFLHIDQRLLTRPQQQPDLAVEVVEAEGNTTSHIEAPIQAAVPPVPLHRATYIPKDCRLVAILLKQSLLCRLNTNNMFCMIASTSNTNFSKPKSKNFAHSYINRPYFKVGWCQSHPILIS